MNRFRKLPVGVWIKLVALSLLIFGAVAGLQGVIRTASCFEGLLRPRLQEHQ
jgi:hypothetical protein